MSPELLFAHVQHLAGAVWLDGGTSGRSFLAWNPTEVREDEDWKGAARALLRPSVHGSSDDFQSGCIGYIGYPDATGTSDTLPEPTNWLARYETSVAWADGQWRIHGPKAFQEEVQHYLNTLPSLGRLDDAPAASPHAQNLTRENFMRGVETIRAWIRDGDCYQVNLTRAVHLHTLRDAWMTYRRLRTSEAAYGAFLRIRPELSILCNSPELLLRVVDGHCLSIPIKGTSPRHSDPAHDQASREALSHSVKDQAELNMIVDLVRNDLGKVSRSGSVRAEARAITGHTNVWHGSQQVHSALRANHDALDALDAIFPPGSVTGAPKRRACQRIGQLEREARGVYCGAIGYISDNGSSSFNVAIRTAVQHENMARYHVGGGIVYDSDPAREWTETLDKARELSRAFGP